MAVQARPPECFRIRDAARHPHVVFEHHVLAGAKMHEVRAVDVDRVRDRRLREADAFTVEDAALYYLAGNQGLLRRCKGR